MENESTITVKFELDENSRIIRTKIDANCSHRDLVCAAMYLLNEAANRVNTPEDRAALPYWIVDAFNSQASEIMDVIGQDKD